MQYYFCVKNTLFKVPFTLLYLFIFIEIIIQHATTKIVPEDILIAEFSPWLPVPPLGQNRYLRQLSLSTSACFQLILTNWAIYQQMIRFPEKEIPLSCSWPIQDDYFKHLQEFASDMHLGLRRSRCTYFLFNISRVYFIEQKFVGMYMKRIYIYNEGARVRSSGRLYLMMMNDLLSTALALNLWALARLLPVSTTCIYYYM